MILRIWKGTTTHENAHPYEQLLKEVVFPGIERKEVSGYRGIQLLKNVKEHSVEYITIMAFENMNAVKEFAGKNYEQSYVIDEAKALLQTYESKATHYELLHNSMSVQE